MSSKCSFESCKKKLSFVDQSIVCGCEKSFCQKHRNALAHECPIDYKTKCRERFAQQANRVQYFEGNEERHGDVC